MICDICVKSIFVIFNGKLICIVIVLSACVVCDRCGYILQPDILHHESYSPYEKKFLGQLGVEPLTLSITVRTSLVTCQIMTQLTSIHLTITECLTTHLLKSLLL